MSVGFTARYVKADENDGDSEYQLFTVDAGYQWRMTQGLSLGLTAYNLTNSEQTSVPISYGGGLSYGTDAFGLSTDIYYNAQIGKPKYLVGLAYLLAANFPLRFGASYDDFDQSVFVSGGLGYQTKEMSADLAYRQRIEDGTNRSTESGDRQLAASVRFTFF
jgi:hypothetical protein